MIWFGNLPYQGILEIAFVAAWNHGETAVFYTDIGQRVRDLDAHTTEGSVIKGILRIGQELCIAMMKGNRSTRVPAHESRAIQTKTTRQSSSPGR